MYLAFEKTCTFYRRNWDQWKHVKIFSLFINVFIYNGNVLNEVRKGPLMTICAEHKTRLNVSTSLLLIAACKMSAVAHKMAASITFLQPS